MKIAIIAFYALPSLSLQGRTLGAHGVALFSGTSDAGHASTDQRLGIFCPVDEHRIVSWRTKQSSDEADSSTRDDQRNARRHKSESSVGLPNDVVCAVRECKMSAGRSGRFPLQLTIGPARS